MARLHWTNEAYIKKHLVPVWQRHRPIRQKLVKQIVVRRVQTTLDHSRNPIVPFAPPQVQNVPCPMANQGRTWLVFCRVAVSVQTWLRDELRERLGQYKRDPKGTKPTKESVEMELLHGRVRADSKGAECYTIISRSSTFPALTRLWSTNHITTEQLMATTINKLADTITKELASTGYDRRAALPLFKETPFWDNRCLLRAESPKYQHLYARIKEMLARPVPEHMVIFALHPVSCLVTMMLLLEDFPPLRVMYMHASVPFHATQSSDEHSRHAMVEALQSREHPKVLIMTYDIGSVGFNLQDANWLTMLEQPKTHADKAQAPARVHRKGQQRETHIEALRDDRNLAEKYLIRKDANRGAWEEGVDWSMYGDTDGLQGSD